MTRLIDYKLCTCNINFWVPSTSFSICGKRQELEWEYLIAHFNKNAKKLDVLNNAWGNARSSRNQSNIYILTYYIILTKKKMNFKLSYQKAQLALNYPYISIKNTVGDPLYVYYCPQWIINKFLSFFEHFEVAKKSQSSLNSSMNADSENNTHFEIMFTIVLNKS